MSILFFAFLKFINFNVLTLDKNSLQKATCRYSFSKNILPKWVDVNKGQQYHPSYNVAPGQYTPVLVKESVTSATKKETEDLLICPMRWGLVPSWHRGSLEDFSLKTTNCRLESICDKPTYRGPLQAGRRCVILSDGYFEWKLTGNGKKQPYFIYFPQEKSLDMSNRNWENDPDNLWTEADGWKGPRLLTMAGIFDIWKSAEAILDGDDHVKMWLDSGKITHKEALNNLELVQNLEFHTVSMEVNNSRNNTISCVLPLSLSKSPAKSSKRTGLTAWLIPNSQTNSPSPEKKRMKVETGDN
uniref:Abasic site processing protein HMCES n=1 Tax=Liphistius thaleban TaxID=1905330 RepID=A0A4Q8K4X1_9ARAC